MAELAKPAIDPKTLRAGVIVAIPMVIAGLQVLKGLNGHIVWTDPGLWIQLLQIVAAGLFGKEVFRRTGDYAPSDLPAEFVDQTKPQ